jgi:16S rRNA (uracil1498-N3)-methyltransferase
MQRIFLAPEQFQGETALITGNDHQHLAKVLRVRMGETIVLLNNQGQAWRATVEDIGRHETRAALQEEIAFPPEPAFALTVA